MKKDFEKEIKSIGEYLGCNENELWSEMKKLIDSREKALIGQIREWTEKEMKPARYELEGAKAIYEMERDAHNLALSSLLTYLDTLSKTEESDKQTN